MPDAVEQLIAAWIAWETNPGRRTAVTAKHAALHALELDGCRAHGHIAAWRRAGQSIPDAVQTLINEHHELKEAA